MDLKKLLLIPIFLGVFVVSHTANNEFFKLEKVTVSSLPEHLIVPDLKSVSVDPTGNVFAFAGKKGGNECFIVKFDKKLKYLKRFGRHGNGPGEFNTKNSTPKDRLSIDANGDVYVIDYNPQRKIVVFDNEGNHKRDIFIDRNYFEYVGHIHLVRIVGEDTFIALQFRWKSPTQGLIFTLNPPKIKLEYPFNEKKIYMDWAWTFAIDCCGENCILYTDSQYIVIGHSQIYKFQVYDVNGNLKLEVHDESRKMGSFNELEMEDIKKNHLMPKSGNSQIRNTTLAQFNADKSRFNKVVRQIKRSKNVIADIKISGKKIYVFPVRNDITVRDKYPVEIYNLNGKIVKKGYFKKVPAKIWKNYAFFYDRNEKDDPLILKYKILDHY